MCFSSIVSSQPSLPTPKNMKKLLSLTDDGESERTSPTPSSMTEEVSEEVRPVTPASPVFARTRKITEIAARRRVGLEKGLSRSRLEIDDELPSKSNSVTDMRAHDQAVGSQKEKPDSRIPVKASLSMSDLSVIDRRAADASSEDSVPVDKRKGAVRTKVNKVTQRKPRRLRSASLDDGKVLRGECCWLLNISVDVQRHWLLFYVVVIIVVVSVVITIIRDLKILRQDYCENKIFSILSWRHSRQDEFAFHTM